MPPSDALPNNREASAGAHSSFGGGHTSEIYSEIGAASSAEAFRVMRADTYSTSVTDEDTGVVASEEVVSVFDITDEPASSREARGVIAGHGEFDLEGSSAPWSSASSHFSTSAPRRPRSAAMTRETAAEALILQGTLGNMLRRLTEDSTLEESAVASVRRVLQLGAVLTGHRLSDEEIRELPKVRFEAEEQQHCAICLEAYQEGELLTALRCNHFFHVECLNVWMQRATQCPLCRHECGPNAPELE